MNDEITREVIIGEEMADEIEKANTKEVGAVEETFGMDAIDTGDIMIPKILIAQAMSPQVTDGKVNHGDIFDTLDEKVLAKYYSEFPKKLEVIIFNVSKEWMLVEHGKFLRTEPFRAGETPNTKHEGVEIGIDTYLVFNFWVLLPKEIENRTAFPYIVPMKSTSTRTARKILTHLKKLEIMKKSVANNVMKLSRTLHENRDVRSKFFVWSCEVGRSATTTEVAAAKTWHDALIN